MDCGPAALKCLLEGLGVPVSYGRLREACQTSVDGTSIDALETVANQLGLDAEQVMIPVDQLLLDESETLPAILVVQLGNGFTHFVVVWRVTGSMVQVMDPGHGRRWMSRERLLAEVYRHSMPVPAAAFREWAASDDNLKALRARLAALGARGVANELFAAAAADPTWRGLGALDAAVRMVTELVEAKGVRKGREARALVAQLCREEAAGVEAIPDASWSVRHHAPVDGEERVLIRGAVLVRVKGRRAAPAEGAAELPAELQAALREPAPRPLRQVLALIGPDGVRAARVVLVAALAAAATTLAEALLLRGLLDDVGNRVTQGHQRLGTIAAVVLFLAGALLLDGTIASVLHRLGRRLEVHLRMAFLRKLPRLGDRYFQSRPASDMAMRAWSATTLSNLPSRLHGAVRPGMEMLAITAGLVWLDPGCAPLALGLLGFSLVVSLVLAKFLAEPDLRRRTHAGALARFALDALLGLSSLRAHRAERAFRREYEAILVEWVRAGRDMAQRFVLPFAILYPGIVLITGAMFFGHLSRAGGAGTLLFLYWAVGLPPLAEELFLGVRALLPQRNTALRLLEPLGALEEPTGGDAPAEATSAAPGAAVELSGVKLVIAGNPVLHGIDLRFQPGEHCAVVGRSGAGKSSLAGLLLGWHAPAQGTLSVDGRPLDAAGLSRLRRETAWVDPAVQIWNSSLYENLIYGCEEPPEVSGPIGAAMLRDVLERLPEGLQTALGEGGGLVSGGEGQRVRLARALLRKSARLAILDEPFRGLDRDKRRALLQRSRKWWAQATLVYISHDVRDALDFPRVLVIEDGQVLEDGDPRELAARPEGRFAALLAAEQQVREGLWQSGVWRRLRLSGGRLVEH
jgi:ATP-binding cassette subfamily B protein